MSNYAIKVLSCRHGRISYLSTETLQWLNRAFELLMPPDPHHIDIKLGSYRHRLVLRALAALESLNKHK